MSGTSGRTAARAQVLEHVQEIETLPHSGHEPVRAQVPFDHVVTDRVRERREEGRELLAHQRDVLRGQLDFLQVLGPDLQVLRHVQIPVLVRRVEEHQAGDLIRESLGVPLNVGAAQRVPDQHIRCRDLPWRATRLGARRSPPWRFEEARRRHSNRSRPGRRGSPSRTRGHALLDEREVKAERSGAGNEDHGGIALA